VVAWATGKFFDAGRVSRCAEFLGSRTELHNTKKVQVHIFRRGADEGEAPLFLLLQRTPEKNSIWQPVTGKVEANERVEEAAVREVLEETGLHLLGDPVKVGEIEFDKDGRTICESIFVCEVGTGDVRTSQEHAAFEWVSPDRVAERLHYESNKYGFLLALNEVKKRWQTQQ